MCFNICSKNMLYYLRVLEITDGSVHYSPVCEGGRVVKNSFHNN